MKIEELVQKYQGVTELPPNQGFKQSWFQKLISKVGWYEGAPWCSFAVKVFWTELYGEQHAKKISGNALKTYLNMQDSISTSPTPGGLVVWRMYKKGKPTSAGHIGLCIGEAIGFMFASLEGNTSASKLDRDGQGIYRKAHYLVWRKPSELLKSKYTGLVLLGFIDPPKID